MPINPNSQAAGVGVTGENVVFSPSVTAKKRIVGIIGTFDPAKTGIVANTPIRVFSAEDVGSQTGFGFMLHTLARGFFQGGAGIETWIIPQAETVGAAAATGKIDYAITTVTAGTLNLYISGERVTIPVTAGMTAEQIATATVAAINAIPVKSGCPVTAVVNGVDATIVDLTAKSKGVWGNRITLAFNIGYGEAALAPGGVTAAITVMATGSGLPDIATALAAMGTGNSQNSLDLTAVIHGYGQDTATLDALSNYNGVGDNKTGNYAGTVHRPFRSLIGNNDAKAGLADLITFGNTRKLDRTNGMICVDGSLSMDDFIAASAMGVMEAMAGIRPEEKYVDVVIPGVMAGAIADRWSDDYDNRDAAVHAGISPTLVQGGSVTMQNVLTFYHPDNVPDASNAYASIRNIALVQNVLNTVYAEFSSTAWKGISIVADKSKVTSALSSVKIRDIKDVKVALLSLATKMAKLGWLYSDAFTLQNCVVTLRTNMSGFDMTMPLIFSIEGGIFNAAVLYDKSIAVLQAA